MLMQMNKCFPFALKDFYFPRPALDIGKLIPVYFRISEKKDEICRVAVGDKR